MTIHVLLSRERPTSIRLTVSPLAEAIAGFRFAGAQWSGCSRAEGDGQPASGVVHGTSAEAMSEQRVATAGLCVAPPRRPRNRQRAGWSSPRIVHPAVIAQPLLHDDSRY